MAGVTRPSEVSAEELDNLAVAAAGMHQSLGSVVLQAPPTVRARAAWVAVFAQTVHPNLSQGTVEEAAVRDCAGWLNVDEALVDECGNSLQDPVAAPS